MVGDLKVAIDAQEDDPAETKTVSADLDRALDLNCDTSSASYGFSVSNRMLSPFA